MEEDYPNGPMGEEGGLQDRGVNEREGIWANMGFVYLLSHFLARAYQTYFLDIAKQICRLCIYTFINDIHI